MRTSNKPEAKLIGGFVAFAFLLIAIGSIADDPDVISDSGVPKPSPQAAPADVGTATSRPKATPLEEFKGCANKGATATERVAVGHVVKLSGMDDWNGILDNPKVFTDYTGGLATHGADAILIASAFGDCYESDNGLVTVYDRDGHVAGMSRF